MKLLCVVPSYWPAFQFGGPIFSVHGLNKALLEKGVDVAVYTTNVGLNGRVPRNQEVYVDGVTVTYFEFIEFFEFLGATGWQFSPYMAKALKSNLNAFDVVYIVSIWNYPTAVAAYYCRKYKKPYILSPRGLLYPHTAGKKAYKKLPYYYLLAKRDLKAASLIHYTTEDEAAQCHLPLGLKNQATVIPNGISVSDFENLPSKEILRERYPVLRDKKIILFLGRINWKKGLDILVKSYAKLTKERDDVHLLIVGNDEQGYGEKVKRWIKDYGMNYEDCTGTNPTNPMNLINSTNATRVTFTGMLTGKPKLEAYAGSDIFVLPSYSENFGMAALEAMACRLPVVISNQVGIHKEVSNAGAGVVIEVREEQLAEEIATLLDNEHMYREMGDNGRRLVSKNFGWDKVTEQIIGRFQRVLATSKNG